MAFPTFQHEHEQNDVGFGQPEASAISSSTMAPTTISDRVAIDAAVANASPEQAKIAHDELEAARLAIQQGDLDAVDRMHFTEPGTATAAQHLKQEEIGRQNFQKDAMGIVTGGAAAAEGFSIFGEVATGATLGAGATTAAVGAPIALNGIKGLEGLKLAGISGGHHVSRENYGDMTPGQDVAGMATPQREETVDLGMYTRAPNRPGAAPKA